MNGEKKLIELLRKTQSGEPAPDWFFLNRLWFDPQDRKEFFDLFAKYCEDEIKIRISSNIICPEGTNSTFGMLPFAALAAQLFESRLIVWKEYGDLALTKPKLLPDETYLKGRLEGEISKHTNGSEATHNKTCTILLDVMRQGTTLYKLKSLLAANHCKVHQVVGIIQMEEFKSDFEKAMESLKEFLPENSKPKDCYKFMITDTKLRSNGNGASRRRPSREA